MSLLTGLKLSSSKAFEFLDLVFHGRSMIFNIELRNIGSLAETPYFLAHR